MVDQSLAPSMQLIDAKRDQAAIITAAVVVDEVASVRTDTTRKITLKMLVEKAMLNHRRKFKDKMEDALDVAEIRMSHFRIAKMTKTQKAYMEAHVDHVVDEVVSAVAEDLAEDVVLAEDVALAAVVVDRTENSDHAVHQV